MDKIDNLDKNLVLLILKKIFIFKVATRPVWSLILKQRGRVLFSPAYLPVSTQSPYSSNPFIQSLLSNVRFLRHSQSQYSYKPESFSKHLQILMLEFLS